MATNKNAKGDAKCREHAQTYLHAIHLVLADDLDADLAILALEVFRAVDVAEGTVAHFLEELPALESGVAWEFALAGILLGDELGQVDLVDTLALG